MKSLVLKDLFNIGHNAKSMLFILVVFAVALIPFSGVEGYIFVCAILCSMMIVTTFSFDDSSKWTRYAMIMPVSKKELVAGKFMVLAIFCAIGSLFGLIIGFIGGMEIPGIVRFQVGFEEGVHYVNPEAKVITKYIGNDNSAWSDPATAKSLAIDCINNGADVCYHAAGGSGIGMIEACTEKDVWAIGVNVDQAHLSPDRVLTSALTKGDQAIYLFTESYLNGSILKGLYDLDCSNDGVGLVDSEHLSEEAKEAVQQAKEKISNGEIKVTKYE